MLNGIVDSVDASIEVAYVKTAGKDTPDRYGYQYEKGRVPSVGDAVLIGEVGSAKRILGIYTSRSVI